MFLVPTGRWGSISGGDTNCTIVTCTAGPDQHEQKRPGQVYFSDITIIGPFVEDWRSARGMSAGWSPIAVGRPVQLTVEVEE